MILFLVDYSVVFLGGEDGLVCVWSLAKLSNKSYYNVLQTFSSGDQTDQSSPLYIFSDHSVRIVGIFIGNCVRCIRLFTTSVDKTCKVLLNYKIVNTILSMISLLLFLFFRFMIFQMVLCYCQLHLILSHLA